MCRRRLRRSIGCVNACPGQRQAGADVRVRVVVIVEDDASMRVALERLLRASGFGLQSYANAGAALAAQDLRGVDGLVIDLALPDLSGFELVDRLRERGVTAPAVLITAHDTARVRAEILRRGIHGFLAKPFAGSALVRALEDVMAAGRRVPPRR